MSITDRLERVAVAQHGLVTTADAKGLGINPSSLRKREGKTLKRVAHGVYRLVSVEPSPQGVLLAAVLAAGRRYARGGAAKPSQPIVASHESALALHRLADFPEVPTITVPPGYRSYEGVGDGYDAVGEYLTRSDLCEIDGIPSVTADKAIAQVGGVPREMRGNDWTGAFAQIELKVGEITGANPSRTQERVRLLVGVVGELAVAWRSGSLVRFTEAVEQATDVLARWERDDYQPSLFG